MYWFFQNYVVQSVWQNVIFVIIFKKRFVQSLQVGVSRHATNSHRCNALRFRFISFCYFNKNSCMRIFLSYVALVAADWITQRAYFLRRMLRLCRGKFRFLSAVFSTCSVHSLYRLPAFQRICLKTLTAIWVVPALSFCTCKFCTGRLIDCREKSFAAIYLWIII